MFAHDLPELCDDDHQVRQRPIPKRRVHEVGEEPAFMPADIWFSELVGEERLSGADTERKKCC